MERVAAIQSGKLISLESCEDQVLTRLGLSERRVVVRINLIGMAGPNIIVSGAVFANQLIAQTLTDYISIIPRPPLNERSPLDDANRRVATLFRALKECIKDLDAYYSQLAPTLSAPPALTSTPAPRASSNFLGRASTAVARSPHAPSVISPQRSASKLTSALNPHS